MAASTHPVILVDGHCLMCFRFVKWVIRTDKQGLYRFCGQESNVGIKLLKEYNLEPGIMIYLIDSGHVFSKYEVILHLSKQLGFPWSIAYLGLIIPKVLRDKLYVLIAERRYQLFGKSVPCHIPTEEHRERFLE